MGLQRWCRITIIGPDLTERAGGELEGVGAPDLRAVDDVARLALSARRLGGRVVLADVVPTLRGLLELAGLGVEMEGEPERGEQPLGFEEGQEEHHAGDLTL